MCDKYVFDEKETTNALIKWIRTWFDKNGHGSCNAIIGMSGGKDSTIVAKLCAEAIGPERVIGVAMPQGNQPLNEADEICSYLGIRLIEVNVGNACDEIVKSMTNGGVFAISNQTKQNIPPRVRMATLYAIAQSLNGRVSCNCNLSEDYVGYATLFGDDCGSFAPLSNLTVTEILKIGDYLKIPSKWVHKTPDDGLPNSDSDEEKFGFTYEELDKVIRTPEEALKSVDSKKITKIEKMHTNNKFKTEIVNVPSFIPIIYKNNLSE